MKLPFYDIYSSYEDNLKNGPPILSIKKTPPKREIKKTYKFLGFDVNSLFGIPAGPLPNSKFMKAAFDFGFDVSVYKSVRSRIFPCHPYPNVLFVKSRTELHPEKTPRLIASNNLYSSSERSESRSLKNNSSRLARTINITNSFGVPSLDPATWQEDVKKALRYEKPGQLLILSFMGTPPVDGTQKAFIDDFARTAKYAYETKAKMLEVNLSCPNIGNEGLVCYDLDLTEKVCRVIRKNIGNTPLLVKVGYYKNDNDLKKLAKIIVKYTNAVCAINTLQTEIVDKNGNQALPGPTRLRSGVCGSCIKWAGLEMVEKLNKIREKENYKFAIVGVGGVVTPDDYFEYRSMGTDLVQSATGAMFNQNLAYDIWKKENEKV